MFCGKEVSHCKDILTSEQHHCLGFLLDLLLVEATQQKYWQHMWLNRRVDSVIHICDQLSDSALINILMFQFPQISEPK